MGCFLVPAGEAIVTTVVKKVLEKREAKFAADSDHIRFSEKLGRLNGLLWGGSGLLAFEHLWHGEISPFFPFLTAAKDPAELSVALHEMSTAGVGMAVLVTVVWAVSVLITDGLKRRGTSSAASAAEGGGSV